jgi:hypothetical protein
VPGSSLRRNLCVEIVHRPRSSPPSYPHINLHHDILFRAIEAILRGANNAHAVEATSSGADAPLIARVGRRKMRSDRHTFAP